MRVDEEGISRQHANIVIANDRTVELLDLESKNGTSSMMRSVARVVVALSHPRALSALPIFAKQIACVG